MVAVYLALGSNLGNSLATLDQAIACIDEHPQIRLVAVGGFYRTAPMGYDNQDDFINTAIAIETALPPLDLLRFTQSIEAELGRVRLAERNGPRTIDIDIALYGNTRLDSKELTLPHPRVGERRFVLQPLCDLDPSLTIEGVGDVSELLANTLHQVVEPLHIDR